MFHKIQDVQPLPELRLLVRFADNTVKHYDVKPLLDKWEAFRSLDIDGVFNCVHVDTGGYGVVWNDELDLSCNELWENGTVEAN